VKVAPPPRLALLQASRAPVAVIVRRGPSKDVEIIRWDLAHDVFERGHWFHGRIYEKRSDLSPDGELFVYFASKFTRETVVDTEYTYAWTAVSRAGTSGPRPAPRSRSRAGPGPVQHLHPACGRMVSSPHGGRMS